MRVYKIIILFFANTLLVNAQTLTHDNQNRITNVVYANGTQITYTYDAVGNRTSQVITGANNGSLPIDLAYFKAKRKACKVALNWETASETNNSHFEIEHSMNVVDFSLIKTIEAVGNSTIQQPYSAEHQSPQKGVNYYRLKQVDIDGSFSYSKLQAVNLSDCFSEEMIVYPNPSNQGDIQVQINASLPVEQLEVYNATGQRINVSVKQMSDNLWIINTRQWSSGTYEVRAIFQDQHSLVEKLIVID